jgi:hypothetical protein
MVTAVSVSAPRFSIAPAVPRHDVPGHRRVHEIERDPLAIEDRARRRAAWSPVASAWLPERVEPVIVTWSVVTSANNAPPVAWLDAAGDVATLPAMVESVTVLVPSSTNRPPPHPPSGKPP